MSRKTAQFITQMKLRELHRQRDLLRASYRQLADEAAGIANPSERLRRLYDGLRALTFAGQPLHPEVVNLEILLREAEGGTLAPDVLELWLGRLGEELEAGRTRSEFVYLFGALLEEWARESSKRGRLRQESLDARRRLVEEALEVAPPHDHDAIFSGLFPGSGGAAAEATVRWRERCREKLRAPVAQAELVEALGRLSDDIYRPAPLRNEARRFLGDDVLQKELADALTILVADLDRWDWPADGLETRALWTRNKWRLYLDEDLPTACLLGIVGARWIGHLERFGDPQLFDEPPRGRFAEHMEALGIDPVEVDPWGPTLATPVPRESLRRGMAGDEKAPQPGSVVVQRRTEQQALREVHLHGESYEGDSAAVNRVVLMVNAEIRLARAAYPDRPLYVVKTDLQNYYPSIPHDVLLTMLGRLGLSEADRAFFGRFLAPTLRDEEGRPRRTSRGVPMGHTLGALLAELLMRLLELYVQREAPVRVVRIVDDICLLTPSADAALAAWRRVEEFCEACGLRVNEAKSGTVCIGAAPPDGLPIGRPRWGMLELDEQGEWRVHPETLEAHLAQTRERVVAARSVFSQVQQYNANAKYLINSLALEATLGEGHRRSAEQALRSLHQDLFGEGRGIMPEVDGRIRGHFPTDTDRRDAIPDGWVYWPITAGGLGLTNVLVASGQYAEADRRQEPLVPPRAPRDGWDRKFNEWGTYYGRLQQEIAPVVPEETKVMRTLTDDFIARGSDLSAGRQRGLATYWRWILFSYGPQILRRFGTFRFLITELVPIQLISRQLVHDSSLEDAAGAEGPGDEELG